MTIKPSTEEAKKAIKTLLQFIGENSHREGLQKTPSRVIKSFREIFSGYNQDIKKILSTKFYDTSTTLRKDVSTDGRYAQVAFTNDFAIDAARRDFTINALSYCPFQRRVYDYFNGIRDLKNKKIVFIGKAFDRIQEDFLRILRFFRFSCYYAQDLDQDGVKACIDLKDNLRLLSQERMKWEMDKLIISDNSPDILQKMFDIGILQMIYPVSQFDKKLFLNSISVIEYITPIDLCHKYSLLFLHVDNLTFKKLINLKFSKREVTKIMSIIKLCNQRDIDEYVLRKNWIENEDYLQNLNILVAIGKIDLITAQQFVTDYANCQKPVFPCTGYDIQKFGIKSKDIGNMIVRLRRSFNFSRNADYRNSENIIIVKDPVIADKYIKNWLSRVKKQHFISIFKSYRNYQTH